MPFKAAQIMTKHELNTTDSIMFSEDSLLYDTESDVIESIPLHSLITEMEVYIAHMCSRYDIVIVLIGIFIYCNWMYVIMYGVIYQV